MKSDWDRSSGKYRRSKSLTLFRTSADTKFRSSAQVNAMLGLKFVEYVIPGEKFKRKANKDNSVTGIQINGCPVGD